MTADFGKPRKAVALKYDRDRDNAPVVAAGGQGQVAEKILELGRQAGIAIQADPDLVEVLARVPVGDEIPVELYQAVAEILAFVYGLNKTEGGGR
ncbi:flagellar biosynthesis protein [Desulfosalsimonas propionicica]|uniref:Flagellar biosynthesis protein n=1 Tax=Desulfosalsimonas propionicica TaxID=332175 RepID=A0A7W0CBH2_9BACT|nr:EscU/YscU/HrcU family type III secretion system export apparatus switch protein [Desulfosalsimonas propionicica]MBA2882670.1 flagellar biosynthesis protein [Desulfosalsimonas propionicica]